MPCASSHQEKLLGHRRLGREEFSKMMVTHLGVDPTKTTNEVADTKYAHARFKFLEQLYKYQLQWAEDVDSDDMQVEDH